MRHFVHYLKRQVVIVDYRNPQHRWFIENQPDDQGFTAPCYHVTRAASGPAARVRKDDSIWLFSQLVSPWGRLPVALDARIVVAQVADRRASRANGQPAFRYTAGEGSCWFPLFDAGPWLARLKSVDGRGEVRDMLGRPPQHAGAALRRIRQLSDSAPLMELERAIGNAGYHFVSYRLIDGTRQAFHKCGRLMEQGQAVWWDRWSLPRRLAERREFVKDEALNAHIFGQMRLGACRAVWGIESGLYGETGSYSLREKTLASELGKYRRA